MSLTVTAQVIKVYGYQANLSVGQETILTFNDTINHARHYHNLRCPVGSKVKLDHKGRLRLFVPTPGKEGEWTVLTAADAMEEASEGKLISFIESKT
jgi:hypothetical protein